MPKLFDFFGPDCPELEPLRDTNLQALVLQSDTSAGPIASGSQGFAYFMLHDSAKLLEKDITLYYHAKREAAIQLENLCDGTTNVQFVERFTPIHHKTPARPRKIFETIFYRGMRLFYLDPHFETVPRRSTERRATVNLQSPSDIEEDARFATEAAELLFNKYVTTFGQELGCRALVLEDLIITRLARQYGEAIAES